MRQSEGDLAAGPSRRLSVAVLVLVDLASSSTYGYLAATTPRMAGGMRLIRVDLPYSKSKVVEPKFSRY
jgi:hypothetical protein